ncbi:hypothetical protein [Alteromonas sp. BMJM2]|uniref:hypothetical protein n=1 Tax=Alteromonas sp. BMJM2 TaxID=2954241 RepID=UPI0022B513F7|nr:hypothetical protein [Alteromonas sp. BMJM2]
MSLLSHKLFDHCDLESEHPELIEDEIDMPVINPGSGLPLMRKSVIDVGGYVLGDGPSEETESIASPVMLECNHTFDSELDILTSAETVSSFDDDFSTSFDSGFIDDDWV